MLQHRPLVVFCAGYMAGILIASSAGGAVAAYGFAAVLASAWMAFDGRRGLIALLIAAMAVGGLRMLVYSTRSNSDVSVFTSARSAQITGVIDGEPQQHASSLEFTVVCNRVAVDGASHATTGRLDVIAGTADGADASALNNGDQVRLCASLDRPRPASNPSGFSRANSLALRGIWAEVHLSDASAVEVLTQGRDSGVAGFAWRIRQKLLVGLSGSLTDRDLQILSGVLLGMRTRIPPNVMGGFITTGTVHILATAGLHVGIIVMLLGWGGYLLGAPRKGMAAVSIGLLWMYDIMAGGRPAVTRAVIVATVYLAATIIERAPEVLSSLAAAAIVILTAQPTTLFDPGFQMSFCTVLMLIALLPIWQEIWTPLRDKMRYKARKAAGWVTNLVGMCLVAQIGAGPLVAYEFHVLPLYGVAANLIVVPLVFVLIPTGLAVAFIGLISTAAASVIAAVIVTPIVTALIAVTQLFGSGPGASAAVGDFPGWTLPVYYVLVCGGGFVWQAHLVEARRRRIRASAVDPGSGVLMQSA